MTVHILLRKGDEILLLKGQGTGYRDGWFSLAAGHVEDGERLCEAAVREVEEEVGIDLDVEALTIVGVMNRCTREQRIDFFLHATDWRGTPTNREVTTAAEIGWYGIDELPDKTIPYIRRALTLGSSQFWFDEFGWELEGVDRKGRKL